MAEAPSSESKINSISTTVSAGAAGSVISVTDTDGNEIISHTAVKSFSHVMVASEEFKIGSTYTLSAGTYSQSLTLQNVVTSVGGGTGGPGGPGGFQNRGRW
jgi:hypothetical protein